MTFKYCFSLFLMAWLVSPVTAQHLVRLPSGETLEGSRIRVDDAGNYLLTTPRGELTFPPGTQVAVAEPAAYEQAQQLIGQNRYDEAIRLLQGIMEEYKNLQWDQRARVLLAGAYHGRQDYARAAELFQLVEQELPEALRNDENMDRYMESMQQSADEEELLEWSGNVVRTGTRRAAAKAQMLRGNLNLKRGEIEMALLDFLRTAELFQDVPEVQEEARAKTAQCMRQLGMADADNYAGKP